MASLAHAAFPDERQAEEEKATESGSCDSHTVGTSPQTWTGHRMTPERRWGYKVSKHIKTAGVDGRAPALSIDSA